MFKQSALDCVGESAVGIVETKDPGDVALDGAPVRQLEGIDDAAQKTAPRAARRSARSKGRRAGRDQIPMQRNTIHGRFPFNIVEVFSPVFWLVSNLAIAALDDKGYVLIR